MSPLKFSSAANRSIEEIFLSAPGEQPFPNARGREPALDVLSNGCGLSLPPLKIDGDFSLVPEVVRDYGVDVRQQDGGVLVSDLLRGSTGVEGRNDRVERYPRTCDTDDAVGVGVDRNAIHRFGRVHPKHSQFDYTAAGPVQDG